jgi:hypothetical protein
MSAARGFEGVGRGSAQHTLVSSAEKCYTLGET